jgi:O-succinylbenzoic acid--CoA ligase
MERVELARLLGAVPQVAEPRASPIVIEEPDPMRFMAAFAAAMSGGGPVFLADPAWGENERAQFAALVARPAASSPAGGRGWLMIPTGGSSGELKFARHDEETIAAAVRGFGAYFGPGRVNAVGILPLHHVSGLMAWMRCVLTGGEYRPWDWKRLEAGELPALPVEDGWFLSVVPTQLQRLLILPGMVAWLRRFRAIFVGGGPVWPGLTEAAARAELPLSLSYGMTETAAMVAAQQPVDFLAGKRNCGTPLPHARIEITPDGAVKVTGDSIFRGYWPEGSDSREFVTADLGRLDEHGQLHLAGRRDAVIITGGKKVQPAEVEVNLRATGEFADVAVIGVPDPEWGEIIVACYPADGRAPDFSRVAARLGPLAGYKHPKSYLAIADWPRNAQGKINRAALRAVAGR